MELVLHLHGAWDSHIKFTFLRLLRILRVLRIMRLMRTWQGLYNVVMVFIRAAPQMRSLLILLFLLNVIFALIGMQARPRVDDSRGGGTMRSAESCW